jgi:hypothetical protein
MSSLSKPKPNSKSEWLNVKQVMSFIVEHNKISEYVYRENEFWKYFLLVSYTLIIPVNDIFFYVSFFAPIPRLMRILAAILAIEVSYMCLFFTNRASIISRLVCEMSFNAALNVNLNVNVNPHINAHHFRLICHIKHLTHCLFTEDAR